MIYFFRFILFSVLLFSFSLVAENRIYLKRELLTKKTEIWLSDIAYIPKDQKKIDQILFSYLETPLKLTQEELKKILKTNDLEFSRNEVVIIPQNKEFSEDEFEKSIQKEIDSSLSEKVDYRIQFVKGERFLPKSLVELKWENIPKELKPGLYTFPLQVIFEHQKVYSETYRFLIEKKIKAMVATRNIERNTKLNLSDFTESYIYTSHSEDSFVTSDITDFVNLTDLTTGDFFLKKNIRYFMPVQMGKEVSLLYQKGNIKLTLTAKALNSGKLGDTIQLRSKLNNALVSGKVIDYGQVLIE